MKVGASLLASAVYCERRLLLPRPPVRHVEPERSLVRGREIHELAAAETLAPENYISALKRAKRLTWFSEGTLTTEYKGVTIVGRFDAALASYRGLRLLVERKVKSGPLPKYPSRTAVFQAMLYTWLHEQNGVKLNNTEVEVDICSEKFCPIHLVRNRLDFCTKRCSFSRRVRWKYGDESLCKKEPVNYRCKREFLRKLDRLVAVLRREIEPEPPDPSLCMKCRWRPVCNAPNLV